MKIKNFGFKTTFMNSQVILIDNNLLITQPTKKTPGETHRGETLYYSEEKHLFIKSE